MTGRNPVPEGNGYRELLTHQTIKNNESTPTQDIGTSTRIPHRHSLPKFFISTYFFPINSHLWNDWRNLIPTNELYNWRKGAIRRLSHSPNVHQTYTPGVSWGCCCVGVCFSGYTPGVSWGWCCCVLMCVLTGTVLCSSTVHCKNST